MQLEYTHDTDYFFFSQLLMRHIETYIQKHPDADNAYRDWETDRKSTRLNSSH